MEAEQSANSEIAGGDAAGHEFLRILAEMLANSVLQDLKGSILNQ